MTNYEMVELLRNKANVSYEEAKAALEAANWDLLDAIVLLEREGRVPESGAEFSTKQPKDDKKDEDDGCSRRRDHRAFKQGMHRFGDFCRRVLHYGNRNDIVASRNGKEIISLPLTAFVILLFPLFWLIVVLMIVGLFLGVRYTLEGSHPSNEKVNEYIHRAENAADRVKHEFQSDGQEPGGDASK
ncbi:MAG: DUF4342 domain-containing protein [Clostridiales bacterium]|jgi:hypothetical protein|nr:DUF4342 domain-containing protein [Clostridiales bacterium]OPZ69429.1 MAG: hypothetical protein BWY81_00429 [Firmicutes bacterium ADurb.Bin467]